MISPHDTEVIYHAANVLLRSSNRGDTWTEISPDLTMNLPERRNGSGNIQYATITTIDESPIIGGVIWAGTDDGNVQVTRDGGRTWTNVDRQDLRASRLLGQPRHRVAPRCRPPPTSTITGYRHDDFKPFVWKTTDYGATWSSIAGNLPNEAVNVIREDRRNPEPALRRDRLRCLRVARRRQVVEPDEERDHDQRGARPAHSPARPGAHRRHARPRDLYRRHLGAAGADAGGARR